METERNAHNGQLTGEGFYRFLFDKGPVPYQSLDADGRIIDVNEAWLEALGYTREEVVGSWFGDYIVPGEREIFPKCFLRFEELGIVSGVEFKLIRKDGTTLQVCFDGRISRNEGGEFLQTHCVFRSIEEEKRVAQKLKDTLAEETRSREILVSMLEDNNQIRDELEQRLTELKQVQRMLVNAEKFASLGKLASDMAHEVNNPLMVISGYAQLALLDKQVQGELRGHLNIIHQECNRAKSIIQRLLMFSRPSRGERRLLDINETIQSVVRILSHQLSLSNIEVKTSFHRDMPLVSADEKQLQEVIMNILNNCRDAMPQGGCVRIVTSSKRGLVKIDITDTGVGMDDATLSRLFEPFFTTKDKGTGLGLSICYGIVQAHEGEILVTSKPGEGTTVSMLLPAKRKEEKRDAHPRR
jgi:PAS domain S-box-containing protein